MVYLWIWCRKPQWISYFERIDSSLVAACWAEVWRWLIVQAIEERREGVNDV